MTVSKSLTVLPPVRRRSLRQRALRGLTWGLVGWVTVTGLGVLALRFVDPPTSAFMLARRWDASRKHEAYTQKHQWVPLSRISPNVQLAFIAAEDQRFRDHFGFDVQAIEDAMEDHLEGRSARGASTLTQQVAKNLFLWGGHSYLRKALEAYFTVLLEVCWPKRRILETHLNVAELGNGIYGVEAASRVFFGHPASTLNLEESALLASVLPNPRVRRVNAPSPVVQHRAEWIADQARRLSPDTLKGF